MRCGFCFARFQDVRAHVLPKGHLPREEALAVVRALAAAGFQKITFAGGEPTLCPWLPELVREAKGSDLLTMVVSNGSRLDTAYLDSFERYLDWMVLSIDSLDPDGNRQAGRYAAGKASPGREHYAQLCQRIQGLGLQLKINTVVHAYNWQEDLAPFIEEVQPDRWKVLQALPVAGQNDVDFDRFAVSAAQFAAFCQRNDTQQAGIPFVPERADVIRGSYVMVDPAGRFFDSTRGGHTYSRPILAVGAWQALQEIQVDVDKFWERDGGYYLE